MMTEHAKFMTAARADLDRLVGHTLAEALATCWRQGLDPSETVHAMRHLLMWAAETYAEQQERFERFEAQAQAAQVMH
jgi:hypothetical protein